MAPVPRVLELAGPDAAPAATRLALLALKPTISDGKTSRNHSGVEIPATGRAALLWMMALMLIGAGLVLRLPRS